MRFIETLMGSCAFKASVGQVSTNSWPTVSRRVIQVGGLLVAAIGRYLVGNVSRHLADTSTITLRLTVDGKLVEYQ